MLQVTIQGEEKKLLTHKEKAKELGISSKTLTRWKQKGNLKNITSISIPGYKRPFYFTSN